MKKILIAGAGQGGLSAGYNLASAGFDVTIFEKRERGKTGHDWHDVFNSDTFDCSGVPDPFPVKKESGILRKAYDPDFISPDMKHVVKNPKKPSWSCYYLDRKFLSDCLISECEKAGVKFVFGAEVLSPVCYEKKVYGLNIQKDGKKFIVYGDMIIDSAGLYSPVRMNLPDNFGITKNYPEKDIFIIKRCYFDRTDDDETPDFYKLYFFLNGKLGIDWLQIYPGYADVLSGGFGSLTDLQVKNAHTSVRNANKVVGDKIIRGGYEAKIPISLTNAKIISDNFAVVGDSASMTVPINGSGIELSMKAGKILADVIINADGDYSAKNLWNYQFRYQKKFGEKFAGVRTVRLLLQTLSPDDVNYLFSSGIIDSETAFMGGEGLKTKDILSKAADAAVRKGIVLKANKALAEYACFKAAAYMMPEKYDAEKVDRLVKLYNRLVF